MNKDIAKQITGFLTAVFLFLGTINVKFEWFTLDSINALEVVIVAAIPLGYTLYVIYKNHFGFTKKAKEQKEVLKQNDLK
ncbi:phage holin [Priestia megaterium]|uniref:phage holin n=1 Tax=Priestia megaterium TaxID=1404 RepID=UPI000CA1AC7D|nr:phage holin [Priestia megaterium]AUO14809.1 PTS mannose transporter subunit IID [Priestia megaterium]